MNTAQAHWTTESLSALYFDAFDGIKFETSHDHTYEAVYYFLSLGGKRIRPLLLLHANACYGGNVHQALPAANALELFHNFTLVHDDIMDKASLRRGKPTVHEKYNLGTAILAGDLLFILSYDYLARVPSEFSSTCFTLFNNSIIKIIEGQQRDSEFEDRKDVSLAEYLEMITNKTAVLIACCLQMGAILAGASKYQQELVYKFGLNLGICFQLKDDILDVYGGQKFGKKIGGDIVQNKKTLLYAQAWENGSPEHREELIDIGNITAENEKIERTISLYDRLHVGPATEKLMLSYYKEATDLLLLLEVENDDRDNLREFADRIFTRKY